MIYVQVLLLRDWQRRLGHAQFVTDRRRRPSRT